MAHSQEHLLALEAALAKAPDDIDLKLRVGCGKAAAGRGADAEKLLREVLAERPASAETNHCLGRALLGKGADIALALQREGVEIHTFTELAAIRGRSGRVAAVETDAGDVIRCELVAAAVGVRPRVELARASGRPSRAIADSRSGACPLRP